MNKDALISQVNALRNMGIAMVQQTEAVLQALDERPAEVPVCGECNSAQLVITRAGGRPIAVCKDCNHNQPA